MSEFKQNGEVMPVNGVSLAAHLPFGSGQIGQRYPLKTPQEEVEFARELQAFQKPVTIPNTADCVEDRPIIALANGETDSDVLSGRVAYQLPGGLALAITKAAVGADAAYLRDAKGLKDAYLLTVDLLDAMGYEDAAHNDCGASKGVKKSVANELPEDELTLALPALTAFDEKTGYYISRNWETKRKLLDRDFYDDWDPAWHVEYVANRFPSNASTIAVDHDDHETRGHDASGIFVITKPGYGLAKTGFHNKTGGMAFGFTPNIPSDILHKLSGSNEEHARMLLELQGVDPQQVLSGLVTTGFPAFAEAA